MKECKILSTFTDILDELKPDSIDRNYFRIIEGDIETKLLKVRFKIVGNYSFSLKFGIVPIYTA